MVVETYFVASGWATPTTVRVCPTLKNMFFKVCVEEEETHDETTHDWEMIWQFSGQKLVLAIASANFPSLSLSFPLQQHVLSILLSLTDLAKTAESGKEL